MTLRYRVRVDGLVQGVGFRPFVYRIAVREGLGGTVWNTPEGVFAEVEGQEASLARFLKALVDEAPPAARVERVSPQLQEPRGEGSFRIVESAGERREPALVSPEVATCADCLREMWDPRDRRYRYPFVNCTNCGPRYTIVERVPYDRHQTTMRVFPLCPECGQEYRDPLDRRFHAEPNACPVCGPRLLLLSPQGQPLPGDPLEETRRLLAEGQVLAIKGLGGFHLACDATREDAVALLRQRKGRPHRPLAVMARDLEVARRYCQITDPEARELEGTRRPILLLWRRDGTDLAPSVAPGQRSLGLMLPYTPLHHLLLGAGTVAGREAPPLLVMTSGNFSGGPIVAENGDALRRLGPLCDALLTHDRDIANRNDDSVGYLEGERLVLVRRSRGFAPLPVPLPEGGPCVLALGAQLHNVIAQAVERRVFLSQHVGDVDTEETLGFLREVAANLGRWLQVEPEVLACDLHPDLLTSHLAREMAGQVRTLVQVQHHHAHLASAAVAHGVTGQDIQALVLDGTGYGPDGTIWGGELLVGSPRSFRRAGHQTTLPLPGGDGAIRRPIRVAVAWLHALDPALAGSGLDLWGRIPEEEARVVRRMVDRGFNCPATSSTGRLFDVAASLLGIRDQVTWEGQAAVELEQAAWEGQEGALELPLPDLLPDLTWDPSPLLLALATGEGSVPDRARAFHRSLARGVAQACVRVRQHGGPERVALCGGVFQNRLLTRYVARDLEAEGLVPLLPGALPVGDGGLALGQVAVARARLVAGHG